MSCVSNELRTILLILSIVLIISCKKNQTETISIDNGKNYFPISIGQYIIYDIDSTAYDELTHIPKTYKYRLKEIITQAFTNDENTTSYRLERYIKYYDSTKTYDQIPWQIKDVWTIIPYSNSIEKTEENIRYVKLIFPVKQGLQWNGNIKNTLGEKMYKYEYADQPDIINGKSFQKTLKVLQNNYRSLIQYQNEEEKYARDVGLIYKEITNLESQTIIPNVPVENRPEKGFIYKMQIVEWGK
ncbi:MAG: hypothetical protein KatS3mg027_0666 [Bacteroidia bacterium]|nr:MAG: hypothetical protein KatS3mg027_0666 [Bacteroidia bacterium]